MRVVRQARGASTTRDKRGERDKVLTLRDYVGPWCDDREARGIGSAQTDRTRLEQYILCAKVDGDQLLGDLPIEDIRPYHARNLIRGLRARTGEDRLAPRTIKHIYRLLHNVFTSAVVEERIISNPIKVEKSELPKMVDADREWRINATYLVLEVELLISSPLLPPERRVLYALKAIAGMRHGEAAALCWRHIDYTYEPLAKVNIVQAYDSIDRVVKETKSEEVRAVPLHPTLAMILAAWKEHWEHVYGRKPTPDDFVAPTRTMQPVNAADLGHAMHDDLDALGLRKEAGKTRKRGGHDLRSWYKTRTVEDGGDSLIVRRTTHAPPKDVNGGYERFTWATICREVSKLKISVLGEALAISPDSMQVSKTATARWAHRQVGLVTRPDVAQVNFASDPANLRRPVPLRRTAARMLEKALLVGDIPKALKITREIAGLDLRGETNE